MRSIEEVLVVLESTEKKPNTTDPISTQVAGAKGDGIAKGDGLK